MSVQQRELELEPYAFASVEEAARQVAPVVANQGILRGERCSVAFLSIAED